jgi:hypothetical protein
MAMLAISFFQVRGAMAQDKAKRIGEIEFFGYSGIDLDKVRAALPFHEGDEFSIETEEKIRQAKDQAREAVWQTTGHYPTDIAFVCCDKQGNWIIFIGLSGKMIRYNPQPQGTIRLPKEILDLYERSMNANKEAVQKGVTAEDNSKGYALSEYPPSRSIQLGMRSYAVGHESLLRRVLETSSDEKQRVVAAHLLGYGRQSKSQLAALARATRDSDSIVRNNATRALAVSASSNVKLAREIPSEDWAEMLLSGTWTDLNKFSFLLAVLTKGRNSALLAELNKTEVRERLIEIARWRTTGHASGAWYILGRMAGIDEDRLQLLVDAGNVKAILDSLRDTSKDLTPRARSLMSIASDTAGLQEPRGKSHR